ncbi:MAG: ABC transporter permease [Ignavibacteriae bacterium]|nr:ABC transporter permease [Ignavibacteriota bacterium]
MKEQGTFKLALRIAVRYIFTVRSFHFITVVSTISIVGIVVGVAAIISVTSIFNGFREFAEKQLIGFDPHIRIVAKEGAWLNNSDSLISKIKSIKDIYSASSGLQGRMIALKNRSLNVITLNAVKENEINSVSGISNMLIIGKFDISEHDELPGIVIGSGLADRLKVLTGDTISLVSPRMIEYSVRTFSQPVQVRAKVTGIFQTNAKEYDEYYAFTSYNAGIELFEPPVGSALTIDIKLKSLEEIDNVKYVLKAIVWENASILTWYDLHKELYNIMQFERYVSFIILSLIIVIAAFNVLASLSMTVVEKRADIGVMKAIGATGALIRKIYLTEGLIIGLLSTSIGTVIGLGFCYAQIEYGLFKLDRTKFIIDAIPVSIHATDVILVVFLSLFLSVTAAIYPAKRASSIIITEALREE